VIPLLARKIGPGFLLRLDKGEEVHDCLSEFCAREKIGFASVSGIGAASAARLGVFDTKTKKYAERDFVGPLEIVSLNGNVALSDGKPKAHLHACIAGHDYSAFGGHLFFARISVTCELFITNLGGTVERRKDEGSGLMLIG
jgi:predicted DNA-binding protein with PD1-like motif